MIKIGNVMSRDVLRAFKDEKILSVVERLQKHRIGAMVIIDKDTCPIGILTERDIIRGLVAYKDKLLKKEAQDIMSAPVLTLTPEEDIESAAMLMSLNRIRRVPVTKDEKLVGLISYRDIANALRKSYSDLEDKAEELEEKANRDPLTGLYNKGYLNDSLRHHFEISKREGNSMSLMFIDIDHFKKINDTYGHQCGDVILKELAALMVEKTRAVNVVGRFGGEEFMIISPFGDYKSTPSFAERLRSTVEEHKFIWEDKTIPVKISIGVAVWNPSVKSPAELVKQADQALYRAKNEGRNRVVVYDN